VRRSRASRSAFASRELSKIVSQVLHQTVERPVSQVIFADDLSRQVAELPSMYFDDSGQHLEWCGSSEAQ